MVIHPPSRCFEICVPVALFCDLNSIDCLLRALEEDQAEPGAISRIGRTRSQMSHRVKSIELFVSKPSQMKGDTGVIMTKRPYISKRN